MESEEATTIHVRRSSEGDAQSLAWLVERFTPLLLAQARYRLGRQLRGLYEPEDLVQDAWLAVLPRLADLRPRAGRLTPVLLRFLSSALLHRYGTLVQKRIAGEALGRAADAGSGAPGAGGDALASVPADRTGVVTDAIRRESRERVLAAIDELSESDREILVLRSIEQVSPRAAATLLGLSENTVSVRHHRALARLRAKLPDSVFAELAEP